VEVGYDGDKGSGGTPDAGVGPVGDGDDSNAAAAAG